MNDIDILMNNSNEIPSNILLEWCGKDKIRYELLAQAIANKDIDYKDIPEDVFNDMNMIDNWSLDLHPKMWVLSLLKRELIVVDTNSFRKWRDNLWPPSNDSETEFFSEELQIAIVISKELYPQKPSGDLTSKTEYSIQKRRIEDALKQYDHLDKSTKASLAKIINPVSKKSFTK